MAKIPNLKMTVWSETCFKVMIKKNLINQRKKVDSFMLGHWYTRTKVDNWIYIRRFNAGKIIIMICL